MKNLTIIILTKNEEQNLEKCIASFKGVAHRIVIIDSFSTDKTVELAKLYECEKLGVKMEKQGVLEVTSFKQGKKIHNYRTVLIDTVYYCNEMVVAA